MRLRTPLFWIFGGLLMASPVSAERLDVADLSVLTVGATPVAGFAGVWFDGSVYTYFYATRNNPNLDFAALNRIEGLLRAQGLTIEEARERMEFMWASETEAAYFALDAALPPGIRWGLGGWATWGAWGTLPHFGETGGNNLSCFAATPTGDSPLCENFYQLTQSHWPAIDLLDGSLEGELPNDANNATNYLYIQSSYAPVFAQAIFTARVGIGGLDPQHWYFQTERYDTYAPGIAPVPEPSTLLLLGSGTVALATRLRRRHRSPRLSSASAKSAL